MSTLGLAKGYNTLTAPIALFKVLRKDNRPLTWLMVTGGKTFAKVGGLRNPPW